MQARLRVINTYLRPARDTGYWSPERIEALRHAALHGVEHHWALAPRWRGRALEALWFRELRPGSLEALLADPGRVDRLDVDTGIDFAGVRLRLPLYIGDMSYGSLAGNPNVAVARLADAFGVVAGVGEGGLHPEVAKSRNIVVQWASGRFGVSADMLRRGLAVNIKIGQGAKPGIGGHLPGRKVVGDIARLRGLPEGTPAISPAPHHDIYSIEDLAQRVKMLNRLTGKPILVKVAATHQARFVAVGVARSTAYGVILDGAGAGTGATPRVVRDHVGLPIELALPTSESLLRDNGVRRGFRVLAGGMVSTGLDMARLIALGADMVVMATGVLIAMGCIMCHSCNTGRCPTALTSSLDAPLKLEVGWAVERGTRFLQALQRTLKALLYLLGEDSLRSIVGRRDLLEYGGSDPRIASLMGVDHRPRGGDTPDEGVLLPGGNGNGRGPGATVLPLRPEVYEKAHVPVTGMGGHVPGHTSPASRPLDHLRIEAAQVTRPPVDPYREPIDTSMEHPLLGRYEAPILVPCSDEALVDAARALGFPRECEVLKQMEEKGALSPNGPAFLLEERPGAPWVEERLARLDEELWERGGREKSLLVVTGGFRDGGDLYKLLALGADLVGPRAFFEALARRLSGKGYEERVVRYENALLELLWELKLLMGAGGVTSIESLRGNRGLLRSVSGWASRLLGVEIAGV